MKQCYVAYKNNNEKEFSINDFQSSESHVTDSKLKIFSQHMGQSLHENVLNDDQEECVWLCKKNTTYNKDQHMLSSTKNIEFSQKKLIQTIMTAMKWNQFHPRLRYYIILHYKIIV